MDGEAWYASPWGRKESDTTEQFHFHFQVLQEKMQSPRVDIILPYL